MNGPSSKYIVITPKLKIISLGEQMEIENKKSTANNLVLCLDTTSLHLCI